MVDLDKCYIHIKNVAVYVTFADFVVVVVFVKHLSFVFSLAFCLDFSLM